MSAAAFKIEWIDSGRDPKMPPDPAFPRGKDCDISGGLPSCKVDVPYPAKRIGAYYVECAACGVNALLTTAGRPDDPRSVTMACAKNARERTTQ